MYTVYISYSYFASSDAASATCDKGGNGGVRSLFSCVLSAGCNRICSLSNNVIFIESKEKLIVYLFAIQRKSIMKINF